MDNIFKAHVKKHSLFSWGRMGDIDVGRPTLGDDTKVLIYRLQQQCLLDVLVRNVGIIAADHYFIEAGRLAGFEYAMHNLSLEQTSEDFFTTLKEQFRVLKIGILTVESFDTVTGEMSVAIANDLDCSGVPASSRYLCKFDEGFLAGIMTAFTGKTYEFKEVDCWGSGDGTCRFLGITKV